MPQVVEAEVLDAIEYGHECCKKISGVIRQMVKACGKKKRVYTPPAVNEEMLGRIRKELGADLKDALNTGKYPKLESYAKVKEIKKKTLALFPEEQQPEAAKVYDILKERIRFTFTADEWHVLTDKLDAPISSGERRKVAKLLAETPMWTP